MAFTAGDVTTRAAIILQDEDNVRWPVSELLGWVNDGAKEVVIRRPAAHATVATLTLVVGDSQELPAAGIQVLDIICNIAANDSRGRAITLVSAQLLDDIDPSWRTATPASSAYHYTFDERAPRRFGIYPAVAAGTKVEAKYSSAPAAADDAADAIDLPDEYLPALVSYVLYRAYAKDSEFANGAFATAHYQAFEAALGINNATTAAASPRGTVK